MSHPQAPCPPQRPLHPLPTWDPSVAQGSGRGSLPPPSSIPESTTKSPTLPQDPTLSPPHSHRSESWEREPSSISTDPQDKFRRCHLHWTQMQTSQPQGTVTRPWKTFHQCRCWDAWIPKWHRTSLSPSSSRKRVRLERQVLRKEVGAPSFWKAPFPTPMQPRKRPFLLLPWRKTDAIAKHFLAPEPCLQMKQCHIPPRYKMAKSGAALAVADVGARASPPLAALGTLS